MIVFASLALAALVFIWMAGTLLLPWIGTGLPPRTFTRTTVCVSILGPFAVLGWFGTHIYKIFNTHLSVEGISIPTLRGRVRVRWSDIERVQVKGHELRLRSATSSIVINVFCFNQPGRVPPFVQRHLPAHCVSQMRS
jgi:hypothetical protein